MQHNILPFERPAPPAPPRRAPPDEGDAGTTYGLHAIARKLGQPNRGEDWKAAYVAGLIAAEHFPAPLPLLVRGQLTRDIHPRKSRWLAIAVEAWFLRQAPAGAIAALASAEAGEAADRLDANADNLFGGDAA